MKFFSLSAALLVTGFSAIGLAEVLLEPLPLRLYTGDSCELRWTIDRDYVSTHDVQKSIRRPDQHTDFVYRRLWSFF